MKRRKDRVEVYVTWRPREYRWRRIAPNGEIVGASSEGYRRKVDALANARRCMTKCPIGTKAL